MSITSLPGELSGNYLLDTTRTRVGFIARHTMSTRVHGRFEEFEGNAHLDVGHPSKSEIRLTIRARSIRTGKPQRDDLLGGKFLDADGHPNLTFVSTRVEQAEENVFRVTGDLTIRTVTRPVTVVFTLTGTETGPRGACRIGARGRATIDRNDWGVNWNAMTTAMVSPKVTLDFDVSVVRRP
ncbi:YceI family protein [Streptomyces sp. BB1-1-1]|uniref:YceI family protein n=1 Tax=Streptomyces sp. BB1-1-1 TaxID=3074430 RepID=UPI0028780C82|nr:YceI family protein [Streptomyces sp. BB1-1-1]WND39721.1 YceI family protein [Streptomyces sp. BB1-1-1]